MSASTVGPQPGGQGLFELGQGAYRGLLDAGDRAGGGRAQADRHGDRLVVVEQQRRQLGAGHEPVAAGGAGGGAHLVPEGPQPFDVVADGPGGDAEPFGEFGPRPVAAAEQQRQEPEKPHGGLH
jgi:hypothetical protein